MWTNARLESCDSPANKYTHFHNSITRRRRHFLKKNDECLAVADGGLMWPDDHIHNDVLYV